jgi:hypothetical protein
VLEGASEAVREGEPRGAAVDHTLDNNTDVRRRELSTPADDNDEVSSGELED